MATPARMQVTAEELAQLQAYAKQEGRRWKDRLQQDSWWRGIPVHGFPLLYGLRNTHGPAWLAKFKLPA